MCFNNFCSFGTWAEPRQYICFDKHFHSCKNLCGCQIPPRIWHSHCSIFAPIIHESHMQDLFYFICQLFSPPLFKNLTYSYSSQKASDPLKSDVSTFS